MIVSFIASLHSSIALYQSHIVCRRRLDRKRISDRSIGAGSFSSPKTMLQLGSRFNHLGRTELSEFVCGFSISWSILRDNLEHSVQDQDLVSQWIETSCQGVVNHINVQVKRNNR